MALGGEVAPAPRGQQIGVLDVGWTDAAARSKSTEWGLEGDEEYVAGISLKNNFDLTVGYLALRYSSEEVQRAAKVAGREILLAAVHEDDPRHLGGGRELLDQTPDGRLGLFFVPPAGARVVRGPLPRPDELAEVRGGEGVSQHECVGSPSQQARRARDRVVGYGAWLFA